MKYRFHELHSILNWTVSSIPDIHLFLRHPEYQQWGARLMDMTRSSAFKQLEPVAQDVAADGDLDVERIRSLVDIPALRLAPSTWIELSKAIESTEAACVAAFVLQLACLLGWEAGAQGGLYEETYPKQKWPGWDAIPMACARAASRLGSLEGAKALVDHAYDVLMSSANFDAPLLRALATHRELAGEIGRQLDAAVTNLADDLRLGCKPGVESFRAEFGALLWTLGLVPESQAYFSHSGWNELPTQRLCKLVVRLSLEGIPLDPLVQYIWLSMKDRPAFDLRAHKSLFEKLNKNFRQLLLDEDLSASPSRLYVRALVSWFSGSADTEALADLRAIVPGLYETQPRLFPVWVRVATLGFVMSEQLGGAGMVDAERANHIRRYSPFVVRAGQWKAAAEFQPTTQETHTRLSAPMFYLCSQLARRSGATAEECAEVVWSIEVFRSGSLGTWLCTNLPLMTAAEEAAQGQSRREEAWWVENIKGALFQLLIPYLPRAFRRVTLRLTADGANDPLDVLKTPPEEVFRHIQAARGGLERLYSSMEKGAPRYVRLRRNFVASYRDIDELLGTGLPGC